MGDGAGFKCNHCYHYNWIFDSRWDDFFFTLGLPVAERAERVARLFLFLGLRFGRWRPFGCSVVAGDRRRNKCLICLLRFKCKKLNLLLIDLGFDVFAGTGSVGLQVATAGGGGGDFGLLLLLGFLLCGCGSLLNQLNINGDFLELTMSSRMYERARLF